MIKQYCRCCGNLRYCKEKSGVYLCAACVRKIHAGKAPSLEEIQRVQAIKLD